MTLVYAKAKTQQPLTSNVLFSIPAVHTYDQNLDTTNPNDYLVVFEVDVAQISQNSLMFKI